MDRSRGWLTGLSRSRLLDDRLPLSGGALVEVARRSGVARAWALSSGADTGLTLQQRRRVEDGGRYAHGGRRAELRTACPAQAAVAPPALRSRDGLGFAH